ncbi:ArsR/SmtB family transcription factor [Leucobacter sp.]
MVESAALNDFGGLPLRRESAEDLARSLRAVADPTRLQILSAVLNSQDQRLTVGQLAELLDLRQPTVTHHVHILVADDYLEKSPDGKLVWLSISESRRAAIEDLLQ